LKIIWPSRAFTPPRAEIFRISRTPGESAMSGRTIRFGAAVGDWQEYDRDGLEAGSKVQGDPHTTLTEFGLDAVLR